MNNSPASLSSHGRSLVPGILLICIGVLFLAVNYLDIDFEQIWPVVLIIPSIAFFVMGFRDRTQFGLFMPATMLLILGILFFTCQLQGWQLMRSLWPLFMMAPGLGLLMMYLFGRRETGLLIPAGILMGLSVIFLLSENGFCQFWPVILILVGIGVLLKHRIPQTRHTDTTVPGDQTQPPPPSEH